MSEVTRHRPWGDSVPTEFVLASDYDQLKAENEVVADLVESRLAENLRLKVENERLASAIRYEQHLANKIGTHGPDCWSWGNAHYECLKRKHRQYVGESILERDTHRKQLDEANSAYARLADGVPAAMAKYHKCKKQLDEARELLAVASEIIHEQAIHIDRPMTDLGSEALTRLDDWMEENKI